jgi:hypothetical protein
MFTRDQFWKGFDRTFQTAGIVAGVTAAILVVVQLKDIRDKARDKKIEEWQNTVIYKIIDDSKTIGFDDIDRKYQDEARDFPVEVPREKLQKTQLQLALLRLIQGQSIIETQNKIYAVKLAVDPQQLMASVTTNQNVIANQIATHISIAREVLADVKAPISSEVFQRRMTQAGASPTFMQQNGPMLLEQLQLMGLAKAAGGMVSALSRPSGIFQLLPPPQDIATVLPQLNQDLIQLLLESDPGNTTETCWTIKDPAELSAGGSLSTLSHMGLITMMDPKDIKDNSGKPCVRAARYQFTPLAGRVKGYFLGVVLGATQQPGQ